MVAKIFSSTVVTCVQWAYKRVIFISRTTQRRIHEKHYWDQVDDVQKVIVTIKFVIAGSFPIYENSFIVKDRRGKKIYGKFLIL